ncbi:uncharacterized protein FFB20_15130 [Fusarium fujikuroi]|uniref:Uncharacterized protein n=1 Tax=Fusarium fujikuroi TaxID=5127 RepID=A0A2H3SBQ7_FUSFU|nr:uncharacterized protein Y057_11007 [Fusarium fujikuroi]QGI88097.1 hypothetical protein CEK25_003053 [Fusarium fujikuroi]SCO15938.1 uncharacterized protein FFC1_12673 [Fusarium fujikuroi]SCO17046.1 uncharacterized protein FFB20_15130 [Fusarium fujikuroi]SCO21122.1 uncharacterized protein FFE2_14864 [Fusarium fujikuroi]
MFILRVERNWRLIARQMQRLLKQMKDMAERENADFNDILDGLGINMDFIFDLGILAPLSDTAEGELRWPKEWLEPKGTFDANLDMLKSWVLDCSSKQEDKGEADSPSLVKGQGCLFTPPPLTERQKREIFRRQ